MYRIFALLFLAPLSLIAEELPKELPPPPEMPPDQFYGEFFKMIFMLGLVIAFLLLVMWFLKRMMSARIEQLNLTSFIKIVERRVLTPKTTLYVIEVFDRRFLVAESHSGSASVTELVSKKSFDDVLEKKG